VKEVFDRGNGWGCSEEERQGKWSRWGKFKTYCLKGRKKSGGGKYDRIMAHKRLEGHQLLDHVTGDGFSDALAPPWEGWGILFLTQLS